VARALINRPSLLLCDEPTGSLDRRTSEAVATLLFELHREAGNVMIVVTHNLVLAERIGRRFELEGGSCTEL
jgi:predicted ABC-type transport system involved in lysophospholipase L1 biosynthesis ATPase subunit